MCILFSIFPTDIECTTTRSTSAIASFKFNLVDSLIQCIVLWTLQFHRQCYIVEDKKMDFVFAGVVLLTLLCKCNDKLQQLLCLQIFISFLKNWTGRQIVMTYALNLKQTKLVALIIGNGLLLQQLHLNPQVSLTHMIFHKIEHFYYWKIRKRDLFESWLLF